MRSGARGIIAGEKRLHKYQLVSSCYVPSRLLLSLLRPLEKRLCLCPRRRPGAEPLVTEGGESWVGGASLKGIITVSPGDVYNHSVEQTGSGERRERV